MPNPNPVPIPNEKRGIRKKIILNGETRLVLLPKTQWSYLDEIADLWSELEHKPISAQEVIRRMIHERNPYLKYE